MKNNSGVIVKTKTGKMGRTFYSKGLVNNKVPVYLAKTFEIINDVKTPVDYEERGILCDPLTLEIIGFID